MSADTSAFGARASDTSAEGFVTVRPGDRCPCGSGDDFGGCCGPAIGGTAPLTAEALMRSRYTAFVIGDTAYLMGSWHPGTRPDRLELDPHLEWMGLEIVATDRGGLDDTRGEVEFAASWRVDAEDGVLHEHSRFARRSGRWWYLDGGVD